MTTLSEFGDVILDPDMCAAMQAAVQTAAFSMPSLKMKDQQQQVASWMTAPHDFVSG